MSSAAYWTERVRRYGHTGWSDPATYWYDQRLRLKAIDERVLRGLRDVRGSALDFGCGVGDFCTLLARHFSSVCGYDLSARVLIQARQRNAGTGIAYTTQLDVALAGPHQLILSVTVLQHIVSEADLGRLLQRFAEALAPGGRVAVMETLAEVEFQSGHLKRRTLRQLSDLFEAAGLVLVATHSFYHPTECPTAEYKRYRSRLSVRVLGRMAGWRLPLAEALLRRLARRHANRDSAYLDTALSPTRILVFARRDESA